MPTYYGTRDQEGGESAYDNIDAKEADELYARALRALHKKRGPKWKGPSPKAAAMGKVFKLLTHMFNDLTMEDARDVCDLVKELMDTAGGPGNRLRRFRSSDFAVDALDRILDHVILRGAARVCVEKDLPIFKTKA